MVADAVKTFFPREKSRDWNGSLVLISLSGFEDSSKCNRKGLITIENDAITNNRKKRLMFD